MKWWWVLIAVLLVPGFVHSANQASLTDQSEKKPWREWMKELGVESPYERTPPMTVQVTGDNTPNTRKGPDYMIRFFFHSLQEVEHVRAKIRFYIPNEVPVESVNVAKCFLGVKNSEGKKMKVSRDLRNQFIAGESGTDLWFRQLQSKDTAILVSIWPEETAKPSYATVTVGKETAKERDIWINKTMKADILNMPVDERSFHFQELSLDDVCQTFSFHEALPLPDEVGASAFENFYTDIL